MAEPSKAVHMAALGWFFVFVGCCTNTALLELLVKYDPGCGHVVTLSQFLMVSVVGFCSFWRFPCRGFATTHIPWKFYFLMTGIFWLVSTLNNKAFDFEISIPVHTVFRSSSLAANMWIGFWFFRKRYKYAQTAGALLVTAGILVLTLSDAAMVTQHKQLQKQGGVAAASSAACVGCAGEEAGQQQQLLDAAVLSEVDVDWLAGVAILMAGLLLTALLGNVQEAIYKKFGNTSWREAMFFSHFLALPTFAVVLPEVVDTVRHWLQQPYVTVALSPFVSNAVRLFYSPSSSSSSSSSSFSVDAVDGSMSVSVSVFVVLFLNTAMSYTCLMGVFTLNSYTSSLTTAMATTVRKFVSLLFSVWYFSNPFSEMHWVGTLLVFCGILVYTFGRFQPSSSSDGAESSSSLHKTAKRSTKKQKTSSATPKKKKKKTSTKKKSSSKRQRSSLRKRK